MNYIILFLFACILFGTRIRYLRKSSAINWVREIMVWVALLFLLIYIFLTLLKASTFTFDWSYALTKANFIPFKGIIAVLSDSRDLTLGIGLTVKNGWYNVIGNVLVTVPLGFFSCLLFKSSRQWSRLFIYGILLSTMIETLQLITSVNFFDVDDILLNALGFVIGGMGYAIFSFMLKGVRSHDDLTRLEIEGNGRIIPICLKLAFTLVTVFLVLATGAFMMDTISYQTLEEIHGEADVTKEFDGFYATLSKGKDELSFRIYHETSFNSFYSVGGLTVPVKEGEEYLETMTFSHRYQLPLQYGIVAFGYNERAKQLEIDYNFPLMVELPKGLFIEFHPFRSQDYPFQVGYSEWEEGPRYAAKFIY